MIKSSIINVLLVVGLIIGSSAFYIDSIGSNTDIDVSNYPALQRASEEYSPTSKGKVHTRIDTFSGQVQDSTNEILVEGEVDDPDATSLWKGAWNTLKLSFGIGGIIQDLFADLYAFFPYNIPNWATAIIASIIFILLAFAIIEGLLKTKL